MDYLVGGSEPTTDSSRERPCGSCGRRVFLAASSMGIELAGATVLCVYCAVGVTKFYGERYKHVDLDD